MKVLVIGETCKDVFVYGSAHRLAPEAPVPVFEPTQVLSSPGMATNVYRNLCVLNSDIKLDLVTNVNWEEITKTRYVDDVTNHMFMRLDENDNQYGECNLDDIDVKGYAAIIISDYDKGFLSSSQIQEIARKNSNIFLDTKKILGAWCNEVRFIKINKSEYERTKSCLNDSVLQKLIVTEGPNGARYKGTLYPVENVERKDSAGAGDTFIAGLVYNFVQTKDVVEAIKFANQCATAVIQKRGVSTP